MKFDERVITAIDAIRDARVAYILDEFPNRDERYGVFRYNFYRPGEFTSVVSSSAFDDVYIFTFPIDMNEEEKYGTGYVKADREQELIKFRTVLLRWYEEGTANLNIAKMLYLFEHVSFGYRLPDIFQQTVEATQDDADWWKK